MRSVLTIQEDEEDFDWSFDVIEPADDKAQNCTIGSEDISSDSQVSLDATVWHYDSSECGDGSSVPCSGTQSPAPYSHLAHLWSQEKEDPAAAAWNTTSTSSKKDLAVVVSPKDESKDFAAVWETCPPTALRSENATPYCNLFGETNNEVEEVIDTYFLQQKCPDDGVLSDVGSHLLNESTETATAIAESWTAPTGSFRVNENIPAKNECVETFFPSLQSAQATSGDNADVVETAQFPKLQYANLADLWKNPADPDSSTEELPGDSSLDTVWHTNEAFQNKASECDILDLGSDADISGQNLSFLWESEPDETETEEESAETAPLPEPEMNMNSLWQTNAAYNTNDLANTKALSDISQLWSEDSSILATDVPSANKSLPGSARASPSLGVLISPEGSGFKSIWSCMFDTDLPSVPETTPSASSYHDDSGVEESEEAELPPPVPPLPKSYRPISQGREGEKPFWRQTSTDTNPGLDDEGNLSEPEWLHDTSDVDWGDDGHMVGAFNYFWTHHVL